MSGAKVQKEEILNVISPLWTLLRLFGLLPFSIDREKLSAKFTIFDKFYVLFFVASHICVVFVLVISFLIFNPDGSSLIISAWPIFMIITDISFIVMIFYNIYKRNEIVGFLKLLKKFDESVSEILKKICEILI